MLEVWLFWLCLFIILAIIELATVNLITIWFALGALASCICSLLTTNFVIQLAVFVIISLLSLILTKPFLKKIKHKEIIKTNLDRVIGKTGIVSKEITPLIPGEIHVDGKYWTAISDKPIQKDCLVEIKAIEGVKLRVIERKEK